MVRLGPAIAGAPVLLSMGLMWMLHFEKELSYQFQRDTTVLDSQRDIQAEDYKRTTCYFTSQGDKLEGWLYEPHPPPPSPPPVVIMGHGLGAQKDMGLHPYAEQFAQAGMAVLVFDYRGFGGSDGDIRHWVSWRRHVQDWQAALDYVASGGIRSHSAHLDTSRVALWGVSYSGGHALVTAANNPGKVTAVVANEPFLGGGGATKRAIAERGVGKVARLIGAALLDKARELLGLGPVYVKLVGSFEELAVLNMHPDELALSRGNQPHPPRRVGGWRNVCTARMLIDNLSYKPLKYVHAVAAPTLIVVGTNDVITPPEAGRHAARIMGDKATLLEKPYGHLELHRKGAEPAELVPIVDFLRARLRLSPPHVDTHPHETPVTDASAAEVM